MHRVHAVFPVLLCYAISLCSSTAPAQQAPAPQNAPVLPQPPKPANRTGERKIESTITALDLDASPPKVTLRAGAMTLTLKPATKVVKEERDLIAADLKVGDTLCLLTLKSAKIPKTSTNDSKIKEECTVTTLNPLTLKVGDSATLTITKVELAAFSREAPLQPAQLAVGQTVAVNFYVRGGDIDVLRLAVVTARPKPKTPRTPRKKKVAA